VADAEHVQLALCAVLPAPEEHLGAGPCSWTVQHLWLLSEGLQGVEVGDRAGIRLATGASELTQFRRHDTAPAVLVHQPNKMVHRSLDPRVVAAVHGLNRIEQGRGIAYHPTPCVLAGTPEGLGYVDSRLEGALRCLVIYDRLNTGSHSRVVDSQPEVGQGAQGVDGMAGVIVSLEGVPGPGARLGDEVLNLRMGHHLRPSGLHLYIVLRPVE